jgi:hypothetical protein
MFLLDSYNIVTYEGYDLGFLRFSSADNKELWYHDLSFIVGLKTQSIFPIDIQEDRTIVEGQFLEFNVYQNKVTFKVLRVLGAEANSALVLYDIDKARVSAVPPELVKTSNVTIRDTCRRTVVNPDVNYINIAIDRYLSSGTRNTSSWNLAVDSPTRKYNNYMNMVFAVKLPGMEKREHVIFSLKTRHGVAALCTGTAEYLTGKSEIAVAISSKLENMSSCVGAYMIHDIYAGRNAVNKIKVAVGDKSRTAYLATTAAFDNSFNRSIHYYHMVENSKAVFGVSSDLDSLAMTSEGYIKEQLDLLKNFHERFY